MIPSNIHFIFGMAPDFGGKPFCRTHYIAIKSAMAYNPSCKIYFWYEHEPSGYWWDMIKPNLVLKQTTAPKEIFGKPLLHVAHQSDVLRLKILQEMGGIYLDLDVITLKPYGSLLTKNKCVMGRQSNRGLCNAVILAEAKAEFLNKWLDSYHTFRSIGRDNWWDEHAVQIPGKLATHNPMLINVLAENAFFYPLWDNMNRVLVDPTPMPASQYAMHLWETFTYDKLLQPPVKGSVYDAIVSRYVPKTFSIITCTLNRLDKCERCFKQIADKVLPRQDCKEWIIINNASTDGTQAFLDDLAKTQPKMIVIHEPANLGCAGARKKMQEMATGDVILQLDNDAYIEDVRVIDKLLQALNSPGVGLVGVSGATVDFAADKVRLLYKGFVGECDSVAGFCMAYDKSSVDKGCVADVTYNPYWLEDTDFCLQIKHKLGLKVLTIPALNWLKHEWGSTNKEQSDYGVRFNYMKSKWKTKHGTKPSRIINTAAKP